MILVLTIVSVAALVSAALIVRSGRDRMPLATLLTAVPLAVVPGAAAVAVAMLQYILALRQIAITGSGGHVSIVDPVRDIVVAAQAGALAFGGLTILALVLALGRRSRTLPEVKAQDAGTGRAWAIGAAGVALSAIGAFVASAAVERAMMLAVNLAAMSGIQPPPAFAAVSGMTGQEIAGRSGGLVGIAGAMLALVPAGAAVAAWSVRTRMILPGRVRSTAGVVAALALYALWYAVGFTSSLQWLRGLAEAAPLTAR